ncbi:MAG TPA: DUF2071 domain-containing protein, partial [Candidatus Obscuribacterales bacterium]
TAQWSNLCIVTYEVPPTLVRSCLPPGLEPDTRDNRTFASLVGLTFSDTRVLGIAWPGFENFPELNLRLYVRHGPDRGVLFVREFVPHPLVVWLARAIYDEPYECAPLVVRTENNQDTLTVRYLLEYHGQAHTLSVTGSQARVVPPEHSLEYFLKEHRWGFGTRGDGTLMRYEVHHPVWAVYPVQSYSVQVDFARVYGPRWELLNGEKPASVILAAGSHIAVFPRSVSP